MQVEQPRKKKNGHEEKVCALEMGINGTAAPTTRGEGRHTEFILIGNACFETK